uniref:Uncharacterized protein n=1 Tax=Solanum tuberosum TaxID=4113 RepID=M1DTT0_SOLTU
MKIKKDWKLSEEQGQISIEIDRTLQEKMRLKVDKEIKSGGFYNVENSTDGQAPDALKAQENQHVTCAYYAYNYDNFVTSSHRMQRYEPT